MITRYALFEGSVKPEDMDAFRAEVLEALVPKWKAFPGATAVRVSFGVSRDDGAPDYPMILATDYPDQAAVDVALASPIRMQSRAATEAVLARYFTGRIHHHVMAASAFPL